MNIELYNKQGELVEYLYQWDRDIELTIKNNTNHTISEIHFSNLLTDCTAVCIPHENGTKVNVPNVFLTKIHALTLHFCYYNENGGFETFFEYIIPIRPRQKPEDYIYTETEIATWKKLASRIDELEAEIKNKESFADGNEVAY